MHCHICDATLSEVHFNSDHGDIEPCMACQIVIQDTLEGFLDKPSADEEDLGYEPVEILAGLSPQKLMDSDTY